MRERLTVAFTLAILGFFATTGVTSAAVLEDETDVMIATGLIALGLMALLCFFYGVRHAMGLDKAPPLEADEHGHEAALPGPGHADHGHDHDNEHEHSHAAAAHH